MITPQEIRLLLKGTLSHCDAFKLRANVSVLASATLLTWTADSRQIEC